MDGWKWCVALDFFVLRLHPFRPSSASQPQLFTPPTMTASPFRPALLLATGLLLAVGLVQPLPAAAPAAAAATISPSPSATLKQRVGLVDIEIAYSRPGMKGRAIFGTLVPYGEVWRTGANNTTRVTFSAPVRVQGRPLAAGTYDLFSLPGREEWTVIFQKAGATWAAPAYDEKNDTLRVTARPEALALAIETFTIDLNDLRDDSATLNLLWEKTRVTVKLEVGPAPATAPAAAR
jgi:hypothetical protein